MPNVSKDGMHELDDARVPIARARQQRERVVGPNLRRQLLVVPALVLTRLGREPVEPLAQPTH